MHLRTLLPTAFMSLWGAGCATVDEPVIISPEPLPAPSPPDLPELCQKAADAVETDSFKLNYVTTTSSFSGFFLNADFQYKKSTVAFAIMPSFPPPQNQPDYYANAVQVAGIAENKIGPAGSCLDISVAKYLLPAPRIASAVDKFIADYASKFEALREKALLTPVEHAPKKLDFLIRGFQLTIIAGRLSRDPTVEGNEIAAIRKRYRNVAIEFVDDPGHRRKYYAIYRDTRDLEERIPPVFFHVEENGGTILYVHNHHEDLNRHYISARR